MISTGQHINKINLSLCQEGQPVSKVNQVNRSTDQHGQLTCKGDRPVDMSTMPTRSLCQPVNKANKSTRSACQRGFLVNLSTLSTCQHCQPVNRPSKMTRFTTQMAKSGPKITRRLAQHTYFIVYVRLPNKTLLLRSMLACSETIVLLHKLTHMTTN